MGEKISAGEEIFDRLFTVAVPNIYLNKDRNMTYSLAAMTENDGDGFLSGSSERHKTINNIVEMFDLGMLCEPVNVLDCGRIYLIILEHLKDWKAVLSNPVRCQVAPPPRDFLLLETYLEHIYERAQFGVSALNASAPLPPKENTFADMFGGAVFQPQVVAETPKVDPNKPILPGGFLADFMVNYGEDD